jgi:hypothetical protein
MLHETELSLGKIRRICEDEYYWNWYATYRLYITVETRGKRKTYQEYLVYKEPNKDIEIKVKFIGSQWGCSNFLYAINLLMHKWLIENEKRLSK